MPHVLKISNGGCPSYMSEHFVKVQISTIITRGSGENFVVPSVSGAAATTFYYNAIKDWNSLPLDVKTKRNFNSFKGTAKTHLRSQLQLTDADNFIYY